MIGFSLALLFTTAAVLTVAVLVSAFRDAFAAFGELRRALAACEDRRVFVLHFSESERERRPVIAGLRPASRRAAAFPAMRRPSRQPALRVAA